MFQFNVPENALPAERGDFLGWYDPAASRVAGVTYDEGQGQLVCQGTWSNRPSVGEVVEFMSTSTSEIPEREYALKVCLGKNLNKVKVVVFMMKL